MHFSLDLTSCTLCWLETLHGISIGMDTSEPRSIWQFVPRMPRNRSLSANCLTVRDSESLYRWAPSIVFRVMSATQSFLSYQKGMEEPECLASSSRAFRRN